MMRAALLQMNSGIDPDSNARAIEDAIIRASGEGAVMLFTPEMSGLLDRNRKRAAASICLEANDRVLEHVRNVAARMGLWVHIGSLAILREDGRLANRGFVIDASGNIQARYDKIHMFDVDLATGESWRESNAYEAGCECVTVETPLGLLGMAICYDIRFPALFDAFGRAGCDILAIPAAFTVPTGQAHWHVLQRARAIEASAYVLSAAQVGVHADGRETYGHSVAIDPWGDVLLDLGDAKGGLGFVNISSERICEVRSQLPSLYNKRNFEC